MKLTKNSELKICGIIILLYAGVISTAILAGKAIGNLLGRIGEMKPIHFSK